MTETSFLVQSMLAEIAVVIFAGFCHIFSKPFRWDKCVCLLHGIELHFHKCQCREDALKYIQFRCQPICKRNQVSGFGD